jgi:MFS family permease
MIGWGAITTATGAVQSYGGVVTCRFLLGFVAAANFPGILFFLSSWYTRKELALRTAVIFSGESFTSMFSI